MEKEFSKNVIADHEIIYKNDKPYIILELNEYEKLVKSKKNKIESNRKNKNKSVTEKNINEGYYPAGKEFMKGLEGIWKNRSDITDSVEYVNNLRKKNSIRPHIKKQILHVGLNKK